MSPSIPHRPFPIRSLARPARILPARLPGRSGDGPPSVQACFRLGLEARG
jgi:hypothetical protein